MSARWERVKGQVNAVSGPDLGMHMGCAYEAGRKGCR